MMKTNIRLPKSIYHVTLKFVVIFIVASAIGMSIGFGRAYAESESNIFVPNAGNVGAAGTFSWGGTYAQGQTTSTVFLYQIYANIRFWHSPIMYPPTAGMRDQKIWTNSRGGSTAAIYSSGYGDRAATRSYFKATSSSPYSGNYYTSAPGTTGSCYNYWNSGNPC